MANTYSKLLRGVSGLALIALPGVATAQADRGQGVTDGDDIVVTSIRASIISSQDVKKTSNEIVDSVVAEDIGRLPDSTGAESLARITGVQVDRLSGEAANVRVRGLPDLTTTYNGREVFTAEGRLVALQDFPSSSISRFDVYKSASANLIEPGIAGLIDVKSRKPFDFKDFRIAGGLTGIHWTQSGKIGFEANGLISKRWDTGIGEIGILVEGSWTQNKFGDSYRQNNTSIATRPVTIGTPAVIPNTFPLNRYPLNVGMDYSWSERWRPAGSVALQWRPSADLEFYADFLYQAFRGNGQGKGIRIENGSGATLSNVVYCPGSTTIICSMTATGGNAVNGYMAAQYSETETYHTGAGAIWKVGGGTIKADVAYTDSVFTSTTFQMNWILNSTGTRTFDFNTPNGATANITDIDLTNPANYRLSNTNDISNRPWGESIQARIDGDMPVELGPIDRIQAGLRFHTRDAGTSTITVNGTAAPNNASTQFTGLPLDFALVQPAFKGDPLAHPLTWISPSRDSLFQYMELLRTLSPRPAVSPPTVPATFYPVTWPARVPAWQSNENSYAAYLQGHYAFELGGLPIDGQLGLRVVKTTNRVSGTVAATAGGVTTITPLTRTAQYADFLPNISARIKLSSELQARFAYTMTRSRPSFAQLNPTLTVGALPSVGTCPSQDPFDNTPAGAGCVRGASSGNIDLKPIESNNYDASLEWYFSRTGSATVGVFRRDVKGFINNITEAVTDPVYGKLNLTRPQNGQKGLIQGVEVGFRTLFDFGGAPQWVRNFGVLANYTYLDHGSELQNSTVTANLPGMQPVTNVSAHLANASIFYESKRFQLRASYNYRSSFQTYGAVANNTTAFVPNNPNPVVTGVTQPIYPTIEDGRGTFDISSSINPTDFLTLMFTVANLASDTPQTTRIFDAAGNSYPVQTRFLDTIYRLGARFRF